MTSKCLFRLFLTSPLSGGDSTGRPGATTAAVAEFSHSGENKTTKGRSIAMILVI